MDRQNIEAIRSNINKDNVYLAHLESMHNYLVNSYFRDTEANLATLDLLAGKKRSSKVDIRRQIDICAMMLRTCMFVHEDHYFSNFHKIRYTRLVECIANDITSEHALCKYVKSTFGVEIKF